MITSFEVGAVFKIINEATPALSAILKEVRDLNKAINAAKKNLAELSKGLNSGAMGTAIAETGRLAVAWGDVAANAAAARMAIGNAQSASARAIRGGGGGGGGAATTAAAARGHRGARGGAGGAHIGGPGIAIPGGGHINTRGGAMAAAGLGGYAVYEAAQMEDTVFQIMYHAGLEYNDTNRDRIRKMLQEGIRTSGYGLHDIAEAATQEIRLFQGTDGTGGGQGLDVLPEMLKAATTEARLKGGSPKEAMSALIGLAHMTKAYDADSVKKLAKDFAFLSISNPSSLESMERAAGYAVPILQSGLNIDAMDTLLLGTALTRAGIKNTKSGTWLREMTVRAMPGTAIFESEKKAEHHDELLKRIGLLDDKGNPTWFTNGHGDVLKMLQIAHEGLEKIPMAERIGVERKLFGAQGSGGMAVLADNAVYEQVKNLQQMKASPEWAGRYNTFGQAYLDNSTVQQSRTAMGEFNNLMMDLGAHILPSVNVALSTFKGLVEGIEKILPGPKGDGKVGGAALLGAGAGGLVGSAVPGVGTLAGAAAGGVLGGVLGATKDIDALKKGERPGDRYERRIEDLKKQQTPTIHLNLNIDGKTVAQAVSEQQARDAEHPTTSDYSQFYGP